MTSRGSNPDLSTRVIETTFRVRYAETDQMGIVHHAAYVVWLEEGRSNYMRARGSSYAEFEEEGISLAVSELYARYGQAARYDQLIKVRCWIEEVKSRQMTFQYEVVDAQIGAIFVTAYTRHICIDRQGKVAKIPDKWRQLLTG
jgi:acyl-CoA thioester hydrolase